MRDLPSPLAYLHSSPTRVPAVRRATVFTVLLVVLGSYLCLGGVVWIVQTGSGLDGVIFVGTGLTFGGLGVQVASRPQIVERGREPASCSTLALAVLLALVLVVLAVVVAVWLG